MKGNKFKSAFDRTICSQYFYSMLVYLIYCLAMVLNNNLGETKRENKIYIVFAVIHLVDAFLFLVAWEDKSFLDYETWPEYLVSSSFIQYIILYVHNIIYATVAVTSIM